MIVVDDRETTQHPEIVELLPSVSITRLEAGDYAFLDRAHSPLGIERSEVNNLVQKLRSGELEEQLTKCQEAYSTVILLTEGVYDHVGELLATYSPGRNGYFRTHVYARTPYNIVPALLVRLSEMGVELIHSPNFECSMEIIKTIYNQRTKPEEEHTLFKKTRALKIPTKLTNNPAVSRLMALCPRLSEKVAIRLINKYGSIWNILNTGDTELLEEEGFGRGLLAKLKEGVGKV